MNATLLVTALALGAPALKDPPKSDIKIAGEWIVESQVTNGRPLKTTVERRYTFTDDGKWTMTTPKGKAVAASRTYTIDTTKKPVAIDMKYTTATTYNGIVKMEGDTLTLCYTRNADERPTKFESPEGSMTILIVLKRAKKE